MISHDARNYLANDKVIGEFETAIESKVTTTTTTSETKGGSGGGSTGGTGESASKDGDGSCQIGTDNAAVFSQGLGTVGAGSGSGSTGTTTTETTTSTPTPVSLEVKVYGVNGQEATELTFKSRLLLDRRRVVKHRKRPRPKAAEGIRTPTTARSSVR